MDRQRDFLNIDIDSLIIRYSLEYLSCNHQSCDSCKLGKAHGPYWYANIALPKKIRRIFLGKSFKPLDIKKVIKNDILKNRDHQRTENLKRNLSKNPIKNLIDKVDTQKIKRVEKVTKSSFSFSPLPTKKDFDRDLILLRGAVPSEKLKQMYRQLIKKYHPDKHPDQPQLNHWMAEINGEYRQKVNETV